MAGFAALLALLALPLAEIAGFVVIGGAIGLLPTLAWVVLAVLLGAALLREAPVRAMQELRAAGAGRGAGAPVRSLVDAGCRAFAGVLLIAPGFVSDAAALLLLLPPVRSLLFAWIASRAAKAAAGRPGVRVVIDGQEVGPGGHPPHGPARPKGPAPVIEGEFREVEEDAPPADSRWRGPGSGSGGRP
jgi:UPF0716 protein FxsA